MTSVAGSAVFPASRSGPDPPAAARRPSARPFEVERLVAGARVVRFCTGTVALFVVSLTLGLGALALGTAAVAGWTPVVITSGSMEPLLEPGDVVLAAPEQADDLGVGSIAVFHDPVRGDLVTHRVVEVDPGGSYQTKGDANQSRDQAPVSPDQLVGAGRLVVPLVGAPITSFRNGDLVSLAGLAVAFAAAVWLARFALLARYDPWAEPVGSP